MNIIEEIKNRYGEKVQLFEKSKKRVFINAAREDTKEIIAWMFNDLKARFSIATAIDVRIGVEILYHMAFDQLGVLVSIRTTVNKPELEMPTITDIIEGANWIEREIHEMLGVNFIGHPNLTRLLLPDDWPEGEYPYRKKTYGSEKENAEREEER
ncbi:MAG: NADH-quinone oxidoreductase subunit C [Candidatus Margulisbacteria bacterium]|nr:NADH-quinone oxidoreductase subunit C [Candidatus Margulisiibacteriota bacterium]